MNYTLYCYYMVNLLWHHAQGIQEHPCCFPLAFSHGVFSKLDFMMNHKGDLLSPLLHLLDTCVKLRDFIMPYAKNVCVNHE